MQLTSASRDRITELELGEAVLAELARGKVVLTVPPGGTDGTVLGLVHVPTEAHATWNELERWERLNEVVPQLRCRVLQSARFAPDERREVWVVELSLGLVKARFTMCACFKPSELRQQWRLASREDLKALAGNAHSLPTRSFMLRSIEGSLSVLPCESGCLVLHENRLVHHAGVPRAIRERLSKQMVREFLGAGRKWLGAAS